MDRADDSILRVVKYKDVILCRHGPNGFTRTMAGKQVMTQIGKCIEEGGSVQAETRYEGNVFNKAHPDRNEVMDATLTWYR